MEQDTWLYWHWGKEGIVEERVPELEAIFRAGGVARILDLGCGTGRHSLFFARMGFQVYGFDLSEKAVNRAKQLLIQERLAADIRCWDMIETPYPYETAFFDAVLAIRVIHHTLVANIERIISEIRRITRDGGLLYLSAPSHDKAMRLKQEGVKSEEVEPGTFVPLEGEEKGILHHHFTEPELIDLLRCYDIVDMRVEDEHFCITAKKGSNSELFQRP